MPRKKILVVDDEPDLVETLTMRLEANDYEVISASNGEDALKKAKSDKPDLVLLDVMMPPPNGYKVCRMLKDDPEHKNLPVILLAAKGSDSDKFWGTESGADAYVTKPYNSQELLEKIRSLTK